MTDVTEQTILVQLPYDEAARVESAVQELVQASDSIRSAYAFGSGDADGYEVGVVISISVDADETAVLDQFCLRVSEVLGANACSEYDFDVAQAKAAQPA